MTEIMREARNVDKIGIAAQRGTNLASDLRNFEGVRESCAWVVGFTRRSHLRFGCETAQAHRMQDSGAITSKLRALEPLDRFLDKALNVCFGVAVHSAPRHGQLGVTKFGGCLLIHVRTIQPSIRQGRRSLATRAPTRPGEHLCVGFLIDVDLTE